MDSITVTLGEREYTIQQLPRKGNSEWRARVLAIVGDVGGIMDAIRGLNSADGIKGVDMGQVADLAAHVLPLLTHGIDNIIDALIAYSPGLQADADYIDGHAYDGQLLDAFAGVLKLAFPFGRAFSVVGRITGSNTGPTGKSLPSVNGTAPQTTLTSTTALN